MKNQFLIGFVVGVVAVVGMFFIEQMTSISRNNGEKSERIRIAKIEACKDIPDHALRALCVIEGGRGDYQ